MPGNINDVPASVIASWPTPDYDTNNRRSWLPTLSYTLLAFSTVLTAGRFYLRARGQAGRYGLDDLFIFLGWLASIGLVTCAVMGSTLYGLDVHTWDVNPNAYSGAALTGWVAQIMFLTSTCATKTVRILDDSAALAIETSTNSCISLTSPSSSSIDAWSKTRSTRSGSTLYGALSASTVVASSACSSRFCSYVLH